MSCDATDALRARIEVLELLLERERAEKARLDMEHIAVVGQAQSALEERDDARTEARHFYHDNMRLECERDEARGVVNEFRRDIMLCLEMEEEWTRLLAFKQLPWLNDDDRL